MVRRRHSEFFFLFLLLLYPEGFLSVFTGLASLLTRLLPFFFFSFFSIIVCVWIMDHLTVSSVLSGGKPLGFGRSRCLSSPYKTCLAGGLVFPVYALPLLVYLFIVLFTSRRLERGVRGQ